MKKRDIEKLSKTAKADNGQKTAPSVPVRVSGEGVVLTRESVDALSEAIVARLIAHLVELLPVVARVGAADTVRSLEKSTTILNRAIDEGLVVASLIKERLHEPA